MFCGPGTARGFQEHFPDPSTEICHAICDAYAYVKCKIQGLRVGKHCLFPGFGSPPMAILHFSSNNACNFQCACKYVKCKMQGLRVGKHCGFPGFGSPPMAMLHFPSNNACNLRCACRYVKCRIQGLGLGNLVFF